MSLKRQLSPKSALRRFGFKQTRKGAIIMGLFASLMILMQGFAYAASYPTPASRASFAATLKSVPALGIMYGESNDLATPASYMVYRTVAFVGLIAAVWGLSTTTRLLRGQEEDGRWELIASGNINKRSASWNVFLGYLLALLFATLIMMILVTLLGMTPDLNLTLNQGILMTLAIFLPALTFAALGYVVSQLAVTRRRAMLYGLVPLIIFFALRSTGNTISDLYWLKNLTPFGWADRLSPAINPQMEWLLPFIGAVVICTILGVYLVAKRDLGAGLIRESDEVSSHLFLLKSATTLAFRQTMFAYIAWAIIGVGLSLLMAAIANVAAQALSDSPALRGVFAQIGGAENNMKIAFLGTGFVLTVIILLLASISGMAAVRSSEAKNYLDNILVQPVRRSSWLIGHLAITVLGVVFISLLCGISTWTITHSQGLSIDLGNLLSVSIALTGTAIFTLGLGTLLYGSFPRTAVTGMYIVLGWSFIIDGLGSVVKLNDIIKNSSLFHYISLSPIKAPDWTTFLWLVGLGVILAVIGITAFAKRDIISE